MSGLVGGGACFVLSAAVAVVGVYLRSRARKQLGWERTEGTIRAASVTFDGRYFRPKVEYTYTHRGRALRGDTVRSPSTFVNWSGPAKRVVARYQPGAQVTVYVNPQNPHASVLEPGGDPKFLVLMLVLSVFFLVFGLMIIRNSV